MIYFNIYRISIVENVMVCLVIVWCRYKVEIVGYERMIYCFNSVIVRWERKRILIWVVFFLYYGFWYGLWIKYDIVRFGNGFIIILVYILYVNLYFDGLGGRMGSIC